MNRTKQKAKTASQQTKSRVKVAQIDMFSKGTAAYGGELRNTRKGRSGPRALSTKHTMHLVLRSSLAKGDWSFTKPKNEQKIKGLFKKFSALNGVRIISLAYVGNHLHCQLQLTSRHTYRAFIRGLTAAIAMAISGSTRWHNSLKGRKFWDYRPFTRLVIGFRAFLNLRDYIKINTLEGMGYSRNQARFLIEWQRFSTA